MTQRLFTALALAGAASACSGERLDPFASHRDSRSHCRGALEQLAARDSDRTKLTIEETAARPRGDTLAVTVIYVQGESRRLFTCLYNPDQPNRLVGGSYRGQALTQAQIDAVNAGRR